MAAGCNAHGVSGSAGIGRHVVEALLEPKPSTYRAQPQPRPLRRMRLGLGRGASPGAGDLRDLLPHRALTARGAADERGDGMPTEREEIARVLSGIPAFAGRSFGQPAIERIGGLTNRNYKITIGRGAATCSASPVPAPALHRPPRRGAQCQVAAAAGVDAEVLFFDPDDGSMLCRYVDGAHHDRDERFRTSPGSSARRAPSGGCTIPAAVRQPLRRVRQDRRVSGAAAAQPGAHPGRLRRAAADRRGARQALADAPARAGALPQRPAGREFPRHRRAHGDRRLGIRRHERSDVGSGRPLGRGGVRAGAGRGAAARLFRRRAAARAGRPRWCCTRACATSSGRSGA